MSKSPKSASEEGTEKRTNCKRDRPARRYGFACSNCRRRKARCDGGLPQCNRCISNNETCHFDRGPSVTYAIRLQNRVKAIESLLEKLRLSDSVECLRILDEHFSQEADSRERRDSLDQQTISQCSSNSVIENDITELLNETSVDEDGRVCFYGSTSLFHMEPDPEALKIPSNGDTSVEKRTIAPSDTWDSLAQIPQSVGQTSEIGSFLNEEYSSTICQELLGVYWCWPHHLHHVVCKKLFLRDIASFGPYATPFLFNALLAQAARYSDRSDASNLSDHYAKRALETLPGELDRGSSIPAIQGLLIFSARECACGRTSQGWLYSGMAFRMMQDLGIHIHPRKLNHLIGQFTPDEMALRQQIFWSCYTWDKTMSLCLGRAPSIHDTMMTATPEMMIDGDEAEEENWTPKFAVSPALQLGIPQKARTISRFIAYCKLCMIIDDVLENLYMKGHAAHPQMIGFYERTTQKLDTWKRELPTHLYAGQEKKIASCPPLHILLLNLVYHATVILLCRPYRSTQIQAQQMATAAAEEIDHLSMLHIRRFGFRVITYLQSYTIFVASTINIIDMKDGIDPEGAGSRLTLNLEVLRNASSTPSNARCVRIIERSLQKHDRDKAQEQNQSSHQTAIAETMLSSCLHARQNQANSLDNVEDLQEHRQRQDELQVFLDPTNPLRNQRLGQMGTLPSRTDVMHFPDSTDHNSNHFHLNNGSFPHYDSSTDGTAIQGRTSSNSSLPTIERPMRWLSDYVAGDYNYEWMMTEMDILEDGINP